MGYVSEQKTTHSLKALFLFFIDNNSECDTHLILVSIYWSIAHSASETCWVPCLKEMKNFTMSEITRELREVKVVVHDHWKDSTDKKQHRQHFDTEDLNITKRDINSSLTALTSPLLLTYCLAKPKSSIKHEWHISGVVPIAKLDCKQINQVNAS